jgi:hypothetical protein
MGKTLGTAAAKHQADPGPIAGGEDRRRRLHQRRRNIGGDSLRPRQNKPDHQRQQPSRAALYSTRHHASPAAPTCDHTNFLPHQLP